jgi:hypothetical protein
LAGFCAGERMTARNSQMSGRLWTEARKRGVE